MSGLTPQPVEALLARALAEWEARRSVFELPRRSFWQGRTDLDLSVDVLGERVATPLGPAAGPHTQLAPNLVVAWLAGARTLELKTVQVQDRLEIPRPCIDAFDVGYNVEWSQELTLDESAREYATAWLLVHALAAHGLVDAAAGPRALSFEASVGYDLAGIASARVARFLDSLTDATALLAALRRRLSPALAAVADAPAPARIVRTVTLSTFHGCPPEEIERIVEHLFARHGVNVIVKLNPTLLGYEAVESLVRGRLGYSEVALDRTAFESDLRWDDALGLFTRLEGAAARAGRALGAKFTNTLVVKNERRRLAGDAVYLSGPPLHPVAITLAARFAGATGGRIPVSFSGGVTADNFADTVRGGLAPVTTCTDLLRPTGYRRLPRYLKALASAMEAAGARTLGAFTGPAPGAAGGDGAGGAGGARPAWPAALAAYARRVVDDPAYAAPKHRATPTRSEALPFLDCASCNNCLLVCPNAAFFAPQVAPVSLATHELRVPAGAAGEAIPHFATRALEFTVTQDRQWMVFADACNDCGNCTTFCPQEGAPQRVKPRFHGSRAAFDAAPLADGIVLEDGGRRVTARLAGRAYSLVDGADGVRFGDGVIEVTLDARDRVRTARRLAAGPETTLSLWPYHALRLLRDAALGDVTPVRAALGLLPAPQAAHPADRA